jgi:hypothetical protein
VTSLRASGRLERTNLRFHLRSKGIDRFPEVIGELHPKPIAWRLPEISAQVQVGFRRDAPLFIYDLIDALMGKFGVLGQSVRSDAERPKEILAEELAGMDIEVFAHGSMVVDNFDVVGALAVPSEADSKLVVSPNAMFASTVTLEGLKVIAGRKTKLIQL